MSTANDLITRALRLGRCIGNDQVLSASEGADGLSVLNSMLDSWSTERLFCYAIRDESFTWAAGSASRTVGAAGNFATDRPVRVDESSYFTVGGIDYAVQFVNSDAYAAKVLKTTSNTFPSILYVEYTSSALVTLYAYPVPSEANTFHLRTWRLLQSFTGLTTTLALPPGYKRAIEYSLAEELAPEYGKVIDPQVSKIAARARANVKRINAPDLVMSSEVGYLNRGSAAGYIFGDIT